MAKKSVRTTSRRALTLEHRPHGFPHPIRTAAGPICNCISHHRLFPSNRKSDAQVLKGHLILRASTSQLSRNV